MTAAAADGQLFTKQMRRATREVHSLSDALINAKLGIGQQPSESPSPRLAVDELWVYG